MFENDSHVLDHITSLPSRMKMHIYIQRLRNITDAATLTLRHLKHWSVDIGIELLYMCSCRFPLDSTNDLSNVDGVSEVKRMEVIEGQDDEHQLLRQRVHIELQRLKTYRSILQVKSVHHR